MSSNTFNKTIISVFNADTETRYKQFSKTNLFCSMESSTGGCEIV